MKLKYIFITLVAAIGLLASCSDDKDLGSLGGIQVSQSYVSIPVEGGKVSFDVTAQDSWKIMTKDKKGVAHDSVPAWITATPKEGGAGTTTVTLEAAATKGANSSTIMLVSGSQIQYVNIIQGVLNPPFSTCAEVIAGNDGDTYKVKGTMTKISNTTYGNWYIKDATGEVYVYGTLDANGAEKNFASLKLEEGDEVTIQGPKTTYGSTVELVNVTVLSYTKSLVKVDSIKPSTVAKEGGEFTAYLTVKGDGVTVDIPEADQSWLSIKGIVTEGTSAKVTFKANANAGGARTSTLSFTSTSGSQSSTVTSEIKQEGSIIASTIADFMAAPTGTTVYRLTGAVTKIEDAAKGNFYVADATGETYVYKAADVQAKGLKVGDIVTFTATKGEYKSKGQATNGVIETVKPVTKVSVADFLTKEDNNDVYYMLTGKASNFGTGNALKYGNFDLVDDTGSAYIYGLLAGWGGASGQFASLGVKEGDEITVITIKTSYNGKPQAKNAMLFKPKQ